MEYMKGDKFNMKEELEKLMKEVDMLRKVSKDCSSANEQVKAETSKLKTKCDGDKVALEKAKAEKEEVEAAVAAEKAKAEKSAKIKSITESARQNATKTVQEYKQKIMDKLQPALNK